MVGMYFDIRIHGMPVFIRGLKSSSVAILAGRNAVFLLKKVIKMRKGGDADIVGDVQD